MNRINHQFKQQTKTRNYYPRPTSPNLQYEERNQITQAKYDEDDIYEWNIDGVSEHQILNILQEMIIASKAYKSRGNSNHLINVHLIVGFTDQLKGWWDNVFTGEENILVQTNLNERGNQNLVHTLIFAITKHFLGDPTAFHTSEILQNIRYRKLGDFTWYKDVYFSKVYTIPNANQPYWKERFLNELPKSLGESVQLRIKEKNNGVIPYDFLTYAQIINSIN